ncbi:Reticulocyte-binding protein 2-like a [Durusdinium trenchii]|uniref:Reticulocyte-binding protein 2-like a n=1 Tax=Durusdinium trenchii TaxID=1381693 RepID=A0ABP0QKT7_9DINO
MQDFFLWFVEEWWLAFFSPNVAGRLTVLFFVFVQEKRRRETESLVADRDGQLRHLRERLSNEEEECDVKSSRCVSPKTDWHWSCSAGERDEDPVWTGELRDHREHPPAFLALWEERVRREQKVLQYEGDLRDSKLEKSEVMTRLSAKESQIVELQRQLAEELTQRQAAQKQLVEKERLLKDAWSREEPIDRLSAQQAIQEQVIEKEREVCSLQQQLADELSKRQAVQYQIIEKDRVICELQTQNRGSRKLSGLMKHPATSASCRRHLDKSATLTYT